MLISSAQQDSRVADSFVPCSDEPRVIGMMTTIVEWSLKGTDAAAACEPQQKALLLVASALAQSKSHTRDPGLQMKTREEEEVEMAMEGRQRDTKTGDRHSHHLASRFLGPSLSLNPGDAHAASCHGSAGSSWKVA